ncbi:MAG: hypothetical protein JWO24_4131 [Rhodospirillales bacterium]|nr:hypothetical protein [Rhodospirillales bacterium]
MFVGLPLARRYSDAWQDDFEQRFQALTARRRRIAYYYTEPDNSTFRYRCYNMVQTVNSVSEDTGAAWFCRADGERLARVADAADVLILGRVRYDTPVAQLVARARAGGARILFDVDDLVCDIRHIELVMNSLDQDTGAGGNWDYWFSYIGRMAAALRLCDGAITTNAFLGEQIARASGLPVAIVPNYLNREQEAVSRAIVSAKRDSNWTRDGRIHIGYFSGSPSHARDFAIVAPSLAALLAEDPRVVVRLAGMLDPHPALERWHHRVEVHPFTDFLSLQRLVGSTEISLTPLQDNVFTNSKSELKYFEAAAVATLTIASPTFTFRQAIAEGRTGLLANELEWGDKIRQAIGMLDDGRYQEMVLAAADAVMSSYGSANQWTAIERAAFGAMTQPPRPPAMPARASLAAPAPVPRRQSILSMLTPGSLGLEIGPSYNPLLPKSEGFNVETVDYAAQATLRAKYAATVNVDIGRIEVVDHVTNGRPLTETIPPGKAYDFILASHVIEHTPDLIGFLADCAAYLKPGGRLVLAVPDKRFCFDLIQPLTFLGDVLQAHEEKRTRPTPMAVLASVAYDVLRGGAIGWSAQEMRPPAFAGTLDKAMELAEHVRTSPEYVDVHCWRFVPSSFRLLIEDLRAVGMTTLREAAFRHHGAHEFFIALSADGAGPGMDRNALAGLMADETAMRRI